MRMTFLVRAAWVMAIGVTPVAWAQARPVDTVFRDLLHARSFGTGGAFRALGLSGDAVGGNPAAMTLYPRFQTELSGAMEFDGRLAFGTLSVMDSSSNKLAAGVSYTFAQLGAGDYARTLNMETFAFAMPVAPWLHFGVSARHVLMSGSFKGPSGPLGSPRKNAITGDAGLILRIGQIFNLGVSAHNLIDTRHPELSRYFVASGGLVMNMFALSADVRADFGALPAGAAPDADPGSSPVLGWSVGAEYILGVVPVRAGFQSDPILGARYLSGGLGLMTDTGNIDIAYRHQLDGSARLVAISVKLGN